MIRALVVFPVMGMLASRWVASMKRYLPDDVVITQVLEWHSEFNKEPYDIVVTLRGAADYRPFQALASPKAMWTEAVDDITVSFFTKGDLLVSYDHEAVVRLTDAGHNVILLSPPIDPEVFYPQQCEKDIDIMSVCVLHADYILIVDRVLDELGLKHLLMVEAQYAPDVKAEIDCCWPPQDNDRMRYNYSRSRYVMSLLADYEYFPGWKCRGWESGNAEGLFCGARPIIFKAQETQYYNKWLNDFAITVDKDNFEEELRAVLAGVYQPVTQAEITKARSVFSAEVVWAKFWDAVRRL